MGVNGGGEGGFGGDIDGFGGQVGGFERSAFERHVLGRWHWDGSGDAAGQVGALVNHGRDG